MTVVISKREEEGLQHSSKKKIYHLLPLRGKKISSMIKIPDNIHLMHAEENGNIECCHCIAFNYCGNGLCQLINHKHLCVSKLKINEMITAQKSTC